MTTRETLHHLVDELPESEVKMARRFLEYLRDSSSDEVLSIAEQVESETAWQAYLNGTDSGESLEHL